mmetsp:Transcript_26589/g.58511  ORF Transcript_26589/g.58511 Transcript_26589/m.58511 type:complete len:93 (+) Transcript_26589:188-466(+)
MKEIKEKFNDLKNKEKNREDSKGSENSQSKLEKQVKWFRDEAMRLGDLVKVKNEEIERLKQLFDQSESERKFLEDQIKASKKLSKQLREEIE